MEQGRADTNPINPVFYALETTIASAGVQNSEVVVAGVRTIPAPDTEFEDLEANEISRKVYLDISRLEIL